MTKYSKYLPDIFLIFCGAVFCAATLLNLFANNTYPIVGNFTITVLCIIGAVISSIIFLIIRTLIRNIIYKSSLPVSVRENYSRYDTFTFFIFLLPLAGATGLQFNPTAIALIIISFVSAQFILIYCLMTKEQQTKIFISTGWLSFLFMISGFAAIIYQIVWQRSLFTEFGVNIESVTIIVSIFMFGLGIGSIMGGIISKKFPSLLPQFFLIFEFLIGIFGIFSLYLIKIISSANINSSLTSMSLAIFGLLFIPTMFMGATLPILVAYLYNRYRHIGKSVGILYFINTVGSAIACFITADVIFSFWGKQTAVIIAAICNFIVGSLVYTYIKKTRQNISDNSDSRINFCPNQIEQKRQIRFLLILLLSMATGYISLSQEILWVRAISYATGGNPSVFAYVLGFFLFGISFGSLLAKNISEKQKDYTLIYISVMLLLSSLVYYLSIPIIGKVMILYKPLGLHMSYILVGTISLLSGGIFPMLCHFGIASGTSVGFRLSLVYFANIIGSTAGPLLTGFVLLNFYSLQQNILFISILTLLIASIICISSKLSFFLKVSYVGVIAVIITGIFSFHNNLYSNILEILHFKNKNQHYKYIIQNRSGIIAVQQSKPDIIYGGGVYDGQFNIDPVLNTNIITRAYMIAALHPNPEEVLEIGLSSGSWARVIANYSDVKKLTIVEINPGYLEIIKKYPEVADILHDPKVSIQIDDGRRWLNRNTDEKFDLIIMNTTLHWRDGATNLLSDEFIKLCKSHLKQGGVVYYNATSSDDVVFTAAKVFKYVTLYSSFVAASDNPFEISLEQKRKNLLKFIHSGKPLFAQNNPALKHILEELITSDIPNRSNEFLSKKNLIHITDDNMATEFKKKGTWYNPKANWKNLF